MSASISIPDASRPFRQFLSQQHPNSKEYQPAKNLNLFEPLIWVQVDQAARAAGHQMSPRAILKILQQRNPETFARLAEQVIGRLIDRSGPTPKWSAATIAKIEKGRNPGGHSTRHGIFVGPEYISIL